MKYGKALRKSFTHLKAVCYRPNPLNNGQGVDDANNVMDLERALHQKWNRIPMAVAWRLISSMMRRCVAVWVVNEGHTRY